MITGKVWLVGAGPSDIGLFTIKGKEILEQAEVVVYDRLVGSGILNLIPKTAERIDVGKRAGNHTMQQKDINELLLRKAKEGKRVVRLKGGDPFLFGRGGEELELLADSHIPFEIVPGITSALSVPAYQGIPVTHRDFCSSLHIITGHKKNDPLSEIDYSSLVKCGGTYIFLMGVSSLNEICSGFIKAGINPDMPAALLSKGTTAKQQKIISTIKNLPNEFTSNPLFTPAVLVVGEVCSLSERFAWYEKLPLGGIKVAITRPKELLSSLAGKLRSYGAEVLEIPSICTIKCSDNTEFKTAIQSIDKYQWLLFTSQIGVRIFFETLKDLKFDIRSLSHLKIGAIGSGTEKALINHGIFPDAVPSIYDGRHLGETIASMCRGKEHILLPRAKEGSLELINELSKKDLLIDDIPIYETIYETECLSFANEPFADAGISYVLFTSASTVKGFVNAVPDIDYRSITALCIGKQTASCAEEFGMRTLTAKEATIDSLVSLTLEQAYLAKNKY